MQNKFMKITAISLLLALSSVTAHAGDKWGAPESDVAFCVKKAAAGFAVSETVLWTLLDVESGTLGKVSQNTNRTVDIGPMQINSIHLPKLKKVGISYEQLRDNLCTNINVGAWIFKQEWARTKNLPQAVASYHSRTPKYQQRYLGLAINALERRINKSRQLAAANAANPVAPNFVPVNYTLPAPPVVRPSTLTTPSLPR